MNDTWTLTAQQIYLCLKCGSRETLHSIDEAGSNWICLRCHRIGKGLKNMARLWRNTEGTREGKYLVTRRDGTIPEWPYFVIGAADPAAPRALRAYAAACEKDGLDPEYVADLRALSDGFEAWREEHGAGDPDAPRHRTDDPETIAKMQQGS